MNINNDSEMDLNVKYSQLKSKIEYTLNQAIDEFMTDFEFLKRIILSRSRINEFLIELKHEYLIETDGLDYYNSRNHKILNNEGSINVYSHYSKDEYEIYCIIPVNNIHETEVYEMITSLINNVPKSISYCLLFYSNDDYLIKELLQDKNIDFIIIRDEKKFSLPDAYNGAVKLIKNEFKNTENSTLLFMDDDAYIMGSQSETLLSNYKLLKKNDHILAVSGHCYDTRNLPFSFYQTILLTNTYEFNKDIFKPYCHGGAAMMMRLKDFPKEGLSAKGLGGINLVISLINKTNFTNSDKEGWFLFNNTELQVFHKIKENIIKWSGTYLAYTLAWQEGLTNLSEDKYNEWDRMLDLGTRQRTEKLLLELNFTSNKSRQKLILGNFLISKYYKPKLKINFVYDDFKNLISRHHSNLK